MRAAAAGVIIDLEPELAAHDTWHAWLRAWASGIRLQLGSVGEEVLEAVRTHVGPEELRVADHGLRLLIEAGFTSAEAGYALWLVVRVACTAGPAERPSVLEPVRTAASESAPSEQMADAIASVEVTGPAAWQFDLDVVIAGLRARLDR